VQEWLCAICNKRTTASNTKTTIKSAASNAKIDRLEEQKEEKIATRSVAMLSKFEALQDVENAGSKNKGQWKKSGQEMASNFDQPLNLAPPRK